MPRKRKKDINWTAVREAMYRSKVDRKRPGDEDLCAEAWKADRVRYGELHAEVRGDVVKKMCEGGTA